MRLRQWCFCPDHKRSDYGDQGRNQGHGLAETSNFLPSLLPTSLTQLACPGRLRGTRREQGSMNGQGWRKPAYCYVRHAGVRGNERAGKPAGTATVESDEQWAGLVF